jgi:nucleoside-diphosphate-sugar epimerase
VRFTIFGGAGFIGRALAAHLRRQGHEVQVPERNAVANAAGPLGHVVYAIGLTADYRTRLFETVEAHVCVLTQLLQHTSFDSWLYLSSTRVYGGLPTAVAREDAALTVLPDVDGLYNLTKLTGEALCLSGGVRNARVARLANVYGPGQADSTFLGSLIRDTSRGIDPVIREAPTSSKDYISIDDVCGLIEAIALRGQAATYNVASGIPVDHATLARALSAASGRTVTFAERAPHRAFPAIDIGRVTAEFGFNPRRLADELPGLIASSMKTPSNP